MPARNIVFVSHANPEDNAFARWLSLKLAGFGYQVWSDVTKLLGGEDIWGDIEPIIRDSTAKFLYVLSHSSNHKEGALRELRVADQVCKKERFKDFVIPLRTDTLPHSDINIEIGRLNVIEFNDWAAGLKQLCEKLAADNVPQANTTGVSGVREWWDREFSADNGVTSEPEVHYSNWFPVQLPSRIYRYSTMGLIDGEPSWPFPVRWHNHLLVTFAPPSEVEPGLRTLRIASVEELDTASFLSEGGPQRQDHRNIVVELIGDAWDRCVTGRGLKKYDMANNKGAFYFDLDALPNPRVTFPSIHGGNGRRGLMGFKTRKASGTRRHWHFAVSARPAIHPQPLVQLRAHVLFSEDGRTIWSSDDAMHRARRSQCKGWWNDDWRDRILATISWLANGESDLSLLLSSASAKASVATRPLEFLSPVTMLEPTAAAPSDDNNGPLDEDGEDEFEEEVPGVDVALEAKK